MTIAYDWLALGAAACWAVTGLISAPQSRHLGAFAFTRWRMGLVFLALAPVAWLSGGLQQLSLVQLGILVLSGLVGIFIGDTALFASMNRLGPRRTGVLFATHAFFSAVLGFLFLDERMGAQALVGGVLIVAGVMTAIAWGARKDESHAFESLQGHWPTGVALGLLAALCQAGGSFIAKPVMAAGVDPMAAMVVRVGVTCLAHLLLLWSGVGLARAQGTMTPRVLGLVLLSGAIGMGLGMSLILLALRHGEVGMVGILSSVSPVLVLPLLWLTMGRAPARGAWWGAAMTVGGTVLVLLRSHS
ncbi:DMT family transporter [Curvibacter sp. APW13]|uniref:DMT family transporter n=1 Tax=Curvibacter sp. APW13 TaxID=3077236 RepID=UPI0028E00089|nr:DMT family transporter [Curvibacter sp. APW13]MDT8989716.1 DMT family transporter [Curvibacter sp. APW13]